MKRKIIPVLIGCTLSFSALAAQPTAERYVVSFPEGTHVNYAGAFASALPPTPPAPFPFDFEFFVVAIPLNVPGPPVQITPESS
ncbi:TPA: hypothetical protein KAL24_002734 [Escherichia coli]|nr:hypothetical protein [Escherichia coli]